MSAGFNPSGIRLEVFVIGLRKADGGERLNDLYIRVAELLEQARRGRRTINPVMVQAY